MLQPVERVTRHGPHQNMNVVVHDHDRVEMKPLTVVMANDPEYEAALRHVQEGLLAMQAPGDEIGCPGPVVVPRPAVAPERGSPAS
ncbi:MAG: hypothetical protein ABI765_17850, partial [Gemmatimonadota bacterium]